MIYNNPLCDISKCENFVVIDDDDAFIYLLSLVTKHQITPFYSASGDIDFLQNESTTDCVIIDVNLGIENGYEEMVKIKSLVSSNTKLVITSSVFDDVSMENNGHCYYSKDKLLKVLS